jgi:hypothetical protein
LVSAISQDTLHILIIFYRNERFLIRRACLYVTLI